VIKRAFKLQCEQLEERANPGTLTATFKAGNLVLIGSIDDDAITLTQPSPGIIQVVGDNLTPIRQGKNGLLIAAGTPVSFGTVSVPVKNLTAKMGPGADRIDIDLSTTRINIDNKMTLDMGEGGTTVKTQQIFVTDNGDATAPNFLTVGGNFTVRGGSGVDNYSLSEISTGGNFLVTDKGGDTPSLFLGSNPLLDLTDPLIGVGGNLTITTGAGEESFLGLIGLDVYGNTTIRTGTGNPTTQKNASVLFGFGLTQTTYFRGGLNVQSSPKNLGADWISFQADSNVSIGGKGLSISTYGGIDTIILNDLYIEGKTSISTGAGVDQVSFDGLNKLLTFTGSVVVKTGDGKDTLNIGDSGQVKFLAKVYANLGKGDDTLTLAATGPVTFTAGFSAIFDGGSEVNTKIVTLANITGPVPEFLNFA